MARTATSRNLWPFSKRKPARKKKAAAKSRFGWLTEKKETYRRDVKGERAELVRQAKAEKAAARSRSKDLLAELKEDAYSAGQNDKQGGRKPTPYRITLLTSPRWEEAFGKRKARELVESSYKAGYRQNPQSCARTKKTNVTDRAKRYRANQSGCRPSGVKKCKLCGSNRFLTVDHIDGDESNGKKSNLRWLCKSCNTRLGAQDAAEGRGRRTAQYNPKGAFNFAEWSLAVAIWNGDTEPSPSMSRERAGEIIHETSKRRRAEFNEDVWRIRKERYGPSGRKDGGAGGAGSLDMPDWVTNPKSADESDPKGLGYQNGFGRAQQDREAQSVGLTPPNSEDNMRFDVDKLVRFWGYTPAKVEQFKAAYLKGYRDGWHKWKPKKRNTGVSNPHDLFDRIQDHFRSNGVVVVRTHLKQWEFKPKHAAMFRAGKDGEPGVYMQRGKHWDYVMPQYVHLGRYNPETDAADDGSTEYQQAKKTAELFHGRPVKEEIEVKESIRTHDWYVSLGPLIELKIRTLTKVNAKLPFSKKEVDIVHLFCSPDGRQFYLRGGDQELDLDVIGMGPDSEWFRDHMLIGEAKVITYRDRKKFHKFSLTEYFHKLGEVTGQKPVLAYDTLAKKLSILGGQYKVEMDDLVDGMSPGIVN